MKNRALVIVQAVAASWMRRSCASWGELQTWPSAGFGRSDDERE